MPPPCRLTRSPTRNGPCAEQDGAREEVAERLLGRETEDDGGQGASEGDRLRRESGDAQRDEQGEDHGHQAQEEADGARRAGVQAAEQVGAERPADVPRERPAEDHQGDDGADAHGDVERRPEQLVAVPVDEEDAGEGREQDDELEAGTLDRAGADLTGQADLAPVVALGVHEVLHTGGSP